MHLNSSEPQTTVLLSENEESSNVPAQILCGICGEAHEHSNCSLVQIKDHIRDSYVPPKAHVSLPSSLSLETMADNTVAIVAKSPIQTGTTFGPLVAEKTFTLNPSIGFPLKIFSREIEDLLENYLDTSDEHKCNWMVLVRPAKTLDQQNLMCYQDMTQLYYVAIKDVAEGEELKVWYAPYYAKLMEKGVLVEQTEFNVADNESDNEHTEIEVNELLRKQQKINRDSWICKFCGKVEEQVTKFAVHMLEHYTLVVKKRCPVCNHGFRSVKSYIKHMKMAHPPTLSKPARTVSQSPPKSAKSKSQAVGGPLLNEIFTESDPDNPNLLLSSDVLGRDLESDTFDNLLGDDSVNKDLDQFNFEIEEKNTGQLLVCDICVKQFGKLPHFILHLKSHTGKFVCTICEKVFARNENLQVHKCKVGAVLRYKCNICKKMFVHNKHLMRHVNVVHENKFKCKVCTYRYYSKREFRLHKCIGELDGNGNGNEREDFVCSRCGKGFQRRAYLQQHMKRHKDKLICDVCAQSFVNEKTLQQHMVTHSQPTLACQNCGKKFHRKDVLKNHEVTHNKEMKTCPSCNKSVTPKTFSLHKSLHTSEKKTKKCDRCGVEFSRAHSLQKHVCKKQKSNVCAVCQKTFRSGKQLTKHALVHSKEQYACPVCNKALKLKSSISRHVKKCHADVDVAELLVSLKPSDSADRNSDGGGLANPEPSEDTACMNEVDKLLGDGDNTISNIEEDLSLINGHNLESMVDNFESIIDNFCDENVGQKDSTIDFGDIDMDLETNFNLHQSLPLAAPTGSQELPLATTATGNQEVCLSMPDLTEDSEIALGDNAYMIDNRTIIDQKDPGNVLVYIL